jgi:hypothetical protein
MTDQTLRIALVDLLQALLGTDPMTARLLYDDVKPLPGTSAQKQRHRIAINRLLGGSEHAAECFLDSLVGCQGSNGRTLRRRGDESQYYVS